LPFVLSMRVQLVAVGLDQSRPIRLCHWRSVVFALAYHTSSRGETPNAESLRPLRPRSPPASARAGGLGMPSRRLQPPGVGPPASARAGGLGMPSWRLQPPGVGPPASARAGGLGMPSRRLQPPGAGPPHGVAKNAGAIHPNAGAIHPNAGAIHPNAGAVHPNAGAEHPNAGAIHPNAGAVHPNAGAIHPYAGAIHPYAGQEGCVVPTRLRPIAPGLPPGTQSQVCQLRVSRLSCRL
jgi:hypothetical protein